jgi:hypothetical protein
MEGGIPVTPFLKRIHRAGGKIATGLARLQEIIELMFLSKREKARRASGRSESLKRREIEAERIDRLRNPSKYQGR